MAAKAAKFKQEGNDLFKAGLFAGYVALLVLQRAKTAY